MYYYNDLRYIKCMTKMLAGLLWAKCTLPPQECHPLADGGAQKYILRQHRNTFYALDKIYR